MGKKKGRRAANDAAPHARLKLAAIRLVGFHNYEDETIRVRGDLFVVGTNESGKTTILDAVHLALSGEQDLDWNAAASLSGPRASGRTIHGIILRADLAGRPRRKGGSITYAALELRPVDDDGHQIETEPPTTIVFGASVTDMRARVQRWGAICELPVAELPLVDQGDSGTLRIVDRDALEARLDGQFFKRIGDYRSAVAEKLFGSRYEYDRLTDLWRKAKSYRELARAARGIGDVFRHVLPSPDPEPFFKIAQGFRDVAEIERKLVELAKDVQSLKKLNDLMIEANTARADYRRLSFIEARQNLQRLEAKIGDIRTKQKRDSRRTESLGELIDSLERDRTELREQTAELRGSSVMDLAARVEQLELRRDQIDLRIQRVDERIRQAESRVFDTKLEMETATKQRDKSLAELKSAAKRVTRKNKKSLYGANSQSKAKTLWDALEGDATSQQLAQAVGDLRTGLESRVRELVDASDQQQQESREAESQIENLERQIERLKSADDMLPRLPGLDDVLAKLAAQSIEASLLYQHLDFQKSTPANVANAVEAVLGLDRLATVVVDAGSVSNANTVARGANSIRVLDSVPPDVDSSDVADGKPLAGFLKFDDERVQRHVECVLADYRVIKSEPDADGVAKCWVTDKGRRAEFGARWSQEFEAAKWIGKSRRKKARAAEQKVLEERINELKSRAKDLAKSESATTKETDELQNELASFSAESVARLDQVAWQLSRLDQDNGDALNAAEELAQDRAEELRQLEAVEDSLSELSRSSQHKEAEALQMRLKDLDEQLEECTNRLADARAEIKTIERRGQGYTESLDSMRSELGECEQRAEVTLSEWASIALPTDGDEVDVDDFDDETITDAASLAESVGAAPSNLSGRIQDAARHEESARTRLLGADGVLNETLATRYGFRVDEGDGRFSVVDRQDHQLGGLLAERDHQETEWRDTLAKQTRDLFERVLARDLVDRLKSDLARLQTVVAEINQVLEPLVFGHSRFQMRGRPSAEHADFVKLLTAESADSEAVNRQLRHYLEDRQSELVSESEMPPFLDYRNWFDFSFALRGTGHSAADDDAHSMGSEDMIRGSGGAQGTHHYLLLWALAGLLFNRSGSRLRLLMMDEAFYGLDSERKELLLRCAKQLDLSFVIATPDLDGTVHGESGGSTTVLVEKNEQDRVSVIGFEWNAAPAV